MDLKNSKYLEEIFKKCRNMGIRNNYIITPERFLFSMVTQLIFGVSKSNEALRCVKMIENNGMELKRAYDTLLEVVYGNDDNRVFARGTVFDKFVEMAKERALSFGLSELSADMLLNVIITNPDGAIFNIMSRSSSEEFGGIEIFDNNDNKNPQEEIEPIPEPKPEKEPVVEPDIVKGFSIADLNRDIDKLIAEIQRKENEEKKAREEKAAREKKAVFDNYSKRDMDALVDKVKDLRNNLRRLVKGQDNAIDIVASGYFQAMLTSMVNSERKRPKATFLFAGPPGMGKTFLAECVANELGIPFRRFDMSGYSDKEANLEFCGFDKSYKDSKPGNVTGFVKKEPRCVLLFDEIEKSHINVIHLFLQLLDAGTVHDNYYDEEISFSDAIVFMTTNAGKQLYEESESGDFSNVPRKVIIKALEKDVNHQTGEPYFPAAICSRVASGNVVMFNYLDAHDLWNIVKGEIEKQCHSVGRKMDIEMSVSDDVYTALLFAEGGRADARTVKGRSGTFFNTELFELLRLVSAENVKSEITDIQSIDISVDLSGCNNEICSLFETPADTRAVVFADDKIARRCAGRGYTIASSDSAEKASLYVKENEVAFVLVDLCCGMNTRDFTGLNIEDADSEARSFMLKLKELAPKTPVYVLENPEYRLSEEEKASFQKQGVYGFVRVGDTEKIKELAMASHQQACMKKLAKENKVVTFKTLQNVSERGRKAQIKLFDFKLSVAVDAEDSNFILNSVSKSDFSFDSVIGAKDAVEELKFFVDYLKNPKKYMVSGLKPPRGVLLYGAPGTGKTLIAKAMAAEAGVPFIAAEGNQFLKKHVGEGPESVHSLFKTARKYAPAILFVDEIDAIAKERRGASSSAGAGEETLTAFLTEMDGFSSDTTRPVFVLAATNFDVEPGGSKSLDPALMRRFDRRVYIDLPDKDERIRFIKMKVDGNPAVKISDKKIEEIAVRATGMSLAQLDSINELALRCAIRGGSTVVTDEIFEDAFETFNGGEAKKWDEGQLERIARHEAGHAVVCYMGGEVPSYITVVSRGDHGGYMQHAEEEGKAIYTRDELLTKIRTALGGRAAEIFYYGERDGVSTGASGDLAYATQLARKIVCSFGMDDQFGLAVISREDSMSDKVTNRVNEILKEQMQEALQIVSQNKHRVDALVNALKSKNHLNGSDIEKIIR